MERKITGTAVDYTHDGKGVVKHESMPVFVPGLLVGETAEILITVDKKTYLEGRVLKRLNDSKERIVPPCPYYESCGGCQIQHMSYREQLKMKKGRIAEVLRRIGGYNGKINDIIPSPVPFHYRSKTQMPYGLRYDGFLIAGFYEQGTHNIIDIDNCLIENETADKVMLSIKQMMRKYQIEPFNVVKKKGWLRYVMVRHGLKTGETLVVFVTGGTFFPQKDLIIKELLTSDPSVKSIVQNINDERTNVVLGAKEKIIYGPGYIHDEINGMMFKIAPKSFFQVNPVQTGALYEKAIGMAGLKGDETVLDAYCGVGTISLLSSKYAKKVVGVEIIKEAIDNARENALLNKIGNTEFYVLDAGEFLANGTEKYDVVFIDPPRSGLSERFVSELLVKKPSKIVYISCEPSSLARDIQKMQKEYTVREVQPVDMFSQTYHVECIVELSLK